MRELKFGEKLPSSSNQYLRVKTKGEQVQFRIAKNPVYVGKHFQETEEGWSVLDCPRINNDEHCDLCEKYFTLKSQAKQIKAEDEASAKKLEKEAKKYNASIQFYFPVLNRGDGKFAILQTTLGVRNKLNDQHEAGVNVFEREWILRNTGSESPSQLYMITPVDSSEVKPLTPEEEKEFTKAKEFDMFSINEGNNVQDEIDIEDIPF